MTARAIMIQGTGSDVGKSIIVAGLCRIAHRRGLSVAPFKPQNMSNNAAACADGGEIGRAQALQARAANLPPETDFNPVLLKPQSDRTAQVIVHGRSWQTLEAADYMLRRDQLMGAVMQSFNRLTEIYDLIIIEGAGSPAEINLRERDIANMGFAQQAGVPVCLVGDIDKGGVIASVVGTQAVLAPSDAAMIQCFLINKFRGNPRLFDDGVLAMETQTGWSCLGVIPWLSAAASLPAEDAVSLSHPRETGVGKIKIVAPMLSRMANFDDADPLRLEPDIDFQWIPPGQTIPRDADAIILFGTKSTFGDLDFLRTQGWDHDIIAHARAGGCVLGLCGGFQMLGRQLFDPDGHDGVPGKRDGLGLLDVETHMSKSKTVQPVAGICARTGEAIDGYEIHAGRTVGPDMSRPMVELESGPDGARSTDGKIAGSYVHGLFSGDRFRQAWLGQLSDASERSFAQSSETSEPVFNYNAEVGNALDRLADGIERAIDVDTLFAAAQPPGWVPELQ